MKLVAGVFGGAILLYLIVIAIGGIILSVAWNTVIPHVFGLPTIDFVQGIALAFVGSILFKSPVSTTSRSN